MEQISANSDSEDKQFVILVIDDNHRHGKLSQLKSQETYITAYENPFTMPCREFYGVNLRFHNDIMGISQQFNRICVY